MSDDILEIVRPGLEAAARIRLLATYPEGWKGEGSKAVSRAAAEDAQIFAGALFKNKDISPPLIDLGADGEINFYWKTARVTIDLGFYGTGTYSYYALLPDGQAIAGDDVPVKQPLPPKLLDLIQRNS